MPKKHTPEFIKEMIKFYQTHKNASFAQARSHAGKFAHPEYGEATHERYREEARGKRQRAKAGKAPGGEKEVPPRCWRDLSTGRFYTDFAEGKPGTGVAIYDLVAKGTINLAYPPGEKGSRKAWRGRKSGR